MSSIWKICGDMDLSGYTVIIPSVAVGNVGQLACDLLISTFKMTKIASVCSPAVIPVVGYDPYNLDSDHLSSSCELYKCPTKQVAVIQLRAPLVFKYAEPFLEELIKKLKENKLKDMIILTSSFAHEKKHIETSSFRYVANKWCPHTTVVQEAKWTAHESDADKLKIFGGGFASVLYDISNNEKVPCLLLYTYCSEGDNRWDAYNLISQLTLVLPLFPDENITSQLVQPASWKFLFGRPPPSGLY